MIKNKKVLSLVALTLLFTFILTFQTSDASAENLNTEGINPLVSGSGWNYKKENVKTSYYWKPAVRVSDDLDTRSPAKSGTIKCDRKKDYGVVASGAYKELGFKLNVSISTTIGYSLTLQANKVAYMAYAMQYKVETGTRVKSSNITGTIVSREPYRVETPTNGRYSLVDITP